MSDDQYDDDLDLNSLSDEELTEQMHDDLYDGLEDEIAEGTQILLDRGWAPDKVLNEALVGGMNIVGGDVVCLMPTKDQPNNITSMVAASVMFEMISMIAENVASR